MLVLFLGFVFFLGGKKTKKVFEYKVKGLRQGGYEYYIKGVLQVLAEDYSISSEYFWPELGC